MSVKIIEKLAQLAAENNKIILEVRHLRAARLKDAADHEQSMRVLIKMFARRGDVIANLKERADNWQANAVRVAGQLREQKVDYDRLFSYSLRVRDRGDRWIKVVGEVVDKNAAMKMKYARLMAAFKRSVIKGKLK